MENTYPRLVSEKYLKGEYPRPACVHDPSGLLATCDICGEPRSGVVVKKFDPELDTSA